MSWLSDLAGKAENLLNKIDQNAASVLQEKDKTTKSLNHEVNVPRNEVNITYSHGELSKIINENEHISKNRKPLHKENRIYPSPSKKSNSIIDYEIPSTSNYDNDITQANTNIVNSNIIHNDTSDDINDDAQILESKIDEYPPEQALLSISSNEDSVIQDDFAESYLDKENVLLKNEISVAHNELSILLTKAKNAERVTENTQIQLVQMEKSYEQLKMENDILSKKVLSYEQKLPDIENDCVETETLTNENKSLQEKVKQLEVSVLSITSLKNNMENDLKIYKNKCAEFEEKLEKVKTDHANTLEEWKNYKIRVNNTLTLKEKMIEELGGDQNNSEIEAINSLNSQINQLKIERNEVMEEVSHLQSEYEYKCKEIDQIESSLRSTERQVSALTEALRLEKSAREISEHTVNNLSKELKTSQTEMAIQISTLRNKLRDSNIIKSEKQMSEATNSLNISETGEDRFRTLTQALVGKQAALESVTADRNALRLQLEKTENKYRSDLVNMRNNQPRIIDLNDTDDGKKVKARFPLILQESPWDSRLSRRVKKAYSSLDSFSVRIGVFLRRNPIARIFIISYMIILHLWVLIVLCTYTPEVHSKINI